MNMIIDCHCHAGAGDGLIGPWDTCADLTKYRVWAAAAGIGHTVLFPAFHSNYAGANREVAAIVSADRRRYSGFAFVHAARDAGRVAVMVTDLVRRHGFRGIKVHRYDARISREICETARALRVPVLYDVMGEVSAADLLAAEYPDVDFIIPHLGSFADDWRAQNAFLSPLARHPNIYTDTSGVRRFDLLEDAVRRRTAQDPVRQRRPVAPPRRGTRQGPRAAAGLGRRTARPRAELAPPDAAAVTRQRRPRCRSAWSRSGSVRLGR